LVDGYPDPPAKIEDPVARLAVIPPNHPAGAATGFRSIPGVCIVG
jgi:hypothetical protein